MGAERPDENRLKNAVFGIENEKQFAKIALDVFHFQYSANPMYHDFCKAIGRLPESVKAVEEIPFLPIQFFKTRQIQSGRFEAEAVFKSSGTTGEASSRHFVKELSLYQKSFTLCFERFYGPAKNFCVLGLLPSYLERGDSSLVYMVKELIAQSGHPLSGFYLYEHEKLAQTLEALLAEGQPTVLFGVSYALLDFAEAFPMPLRNTVLVETGGMKGRRKELTKEELYARLQAAFSLTEIHSEYGMTELLSQAYAVNGLYATPPWMKVLLREETDPFFFSNRAGAINVIDLANLYSCSFIATDDRGRMHNDGRFEVLGRLDNSDVRGCSQMITG